MDKYRLHSLLSQAPDLLRDLRAETVGSLSEPRDAVSLAWREGRRTLAAEWISIYDEVEDEQRNARVGQQPAG